MGTLGTRMPFLLVQSISFLCSFRQKICQIIGCRIPPPFGVGASSLGNPTLERVAAEQEKCEVTALPLMNLDGKQNSSKPLVRQRDYCTEIHLCTSYLACYVN